MTLKQRFAEWLSDAFGIVPRMDYDAVQKRQHEALRAAEDSRRREVACFERYQELLNDTYKRSYQPFEQYAEAAEVVTQRTNLVDLRCVEWRWAVRLEDRRFATMRDPRGETKAIREHAIVGLTKAFSKHIRQQIFNEP